MQKSANSKNGYVMLALLLAVVIMVILYMIDLTAMFGPTEKIDPYAERPWFEEKRLLNPQDFPIKQTGKGGKVIIENKTILKGLVRREEEKRGDIEIAADANGLIKGHWECAYQYTDSSYANSAEFAGNIDPTKTYQDKTRKNKQPLYFITKGKYQQIKTDIATGNQWTTEETIYVVGWIHPVRDKVSLTPDGHMRPVSNGIQKDFSARGKLFLMTADGGNAEYDWQTSPTESKNADKN
jgi:hypothetical protein